MDTDGITLQIVIKNGIPILQNLVSDFFGVVIGILVVQRVQAWWCRRQYGGWKVVVRNKGNECVRRSVSHEKAREVLNEEADLSVFLKGVVNPYGRINCDLVSTGIDRGLLVLDREKREFIINLENNPSQDEAHKCIEGDEKAPQDQERTIDEAPIDLSY